MVKPIVKYSLTYLPLQATIWTELRTRRETGLWRPRFFAHKKESNLVLAALNSALRMFGTSLFSCGGKFVNKSVRIISLKPKFHLLTDENKIWNLVLAVQAHTLRHSLTTQHGAQPNGLFMVALAILSKPPKSPATYCFAPLTVQRCSAMSIDERLDFCARVSLCNRIKTLSRTQIPLVLLRYWKSTPDSLKWLEIDLIKVAVQAKTSWKTKGQWKS